MYMSTLGFLANTVFRTLLEIYITRPKPHNPPTAVKNTLTC